MGETETRVALDFQSSEIETRVALDLGDGGEIEGPKNAISAPRSAEIETLDIEVFMTAFKSVSKVCQKC